MNINISVIIPTYNRSEQLKTCLKSILSQTYSKKKYEIIIVNDKSSDSTHIIISNFIKNYKNIKLVNNRINKFKFFGCRGV